MDAAYASTADYVKIHILGFEANKDARGLSAAGAPPPNADARAVWRANDFPYNYEAGVSHYNVWCTRALGKDELDAVVEQHAPAANHETVRFVNPAALASIPSVWHAHVLVRGRQE
jgi:hypothetical protein